MTSSSDNLSNVRTYHGATNIQIANGTQLPIHAIGDINSSVKNVFVSPELSTSLISVGQLVDNNYDVRFSRDGCIVEDQLSRKILVKGPKVGRLFPLHFSISNFVTLACTIVNKQSEVWHKRLGHSNSVVSSHLVNSGFLGNKDQFSSHLSVDRSTCKLGKSKSLSFPSHNSRAESCFDLIHNDVWGITPVISHAKYKYFVTFIDDYNKIPRFIFFVLNLRYFLSFKNLSPMLGLNFFQESKVLRSDLGGEYMSHEFHDFLQNKGIVSQRSCPYTP